MAFIAALEPPTNLPLFYNVSMAVGRGAPNRRDDVMLVQFFLREIHSEPNPPGRFGHLLTAIDEEIVVDGRCGRTTLKAIRQYQKDVQRSGFVIRPDGRVDMARGNQSSISRTIYTVIFLNLDYKKMHPNDFDQLEVRPDVPPELASSILGVPLDQLGALLGR